MKPVEALARTGALTAATTTAPTTTRSSEPEGEGS